MQSATLEYIKGQYGNEDQEYGVNLFVRHHLEEIEPEYWMKLVGTKEPSSAQVLDSLVLVGQWESEGNIIYDYSLPDNVTQYLISVTVGKVGEILSVEMES
ncbi:DUF2004 domain-containing protein [Marinobacter zhejiangensis]|uniref:Uncharacterized protein n=1 Tax=Marinobacter zhejiangensis TaxID=488535 RepID=A0A1I4NDA8_9GAMM|nr:DUF2004 domain-containing protein [Marinobacter zhejiangensis]SFM13297.1 Protein of unknown function [Marinobacter zhejiangensis]